MIKLIVVIGLTLVACCPGARTDEPEIYYDHALAICMKPNKPYDDIKSVPHMLKLVDFLTELPYISALADCSRQYRGSSVDLKLLIKTNPSFQDYACGIEKIHLIEEFNRKYLSTTKKDKKLQKERNNDALFVYRVFFMHYAYKISSTCKQALLDEIKSNPMQIVDIDGQQASKHLEKLDQFLQKFSDHLSLDVETKGYAALYLPWRMIDNLHVKKRDRKYLGDLLKDCTSSDCTRLAISMNNPGPLVSLQNLCRDNLRPIYSKQILPIIRLVSLGFYNNDEPLLAELKTNKNLKRMFHLTQICETLLPFEVFKDEWLKAGKVVALTRENAKKLRAGKAKPIELHPMPFKVTVEREIVNPPLIDLKQIDSLRDREESKRLVDTIVANRKEQEDVVGNMMSGFMKHFKNPLKSNTGHLMALTNLLNDNETTEIEIQANGDGEDVWKDPITFKSVMTKIGHFFYRVFKVIAICIAISALVASLFCLMLAG